MYDFLIVGAGFAGSVIAERIASQLNKKVLLVEKRNYVGGNAYDEKNEFGILVHNYGPHIFHTNSTEVFNYLSQFTDWVNYEHKVLAKHNDLFYPIPINRLTLNKLYNLDLKTSDDVEKYYDSVKINRFPVLTSEDIIVTQIGKDLYEIFFKHYTKKQWDLFPNELSSAVCGRIPLRTNDDCRYFTDQYQFMPKDGYSKLFERMLNHKNIEVVLETDYKNIMDDIKFDRMIFTGPIDYFFDYEFGALPYRSLELDFENIELERFQDAAVVNLVDPEINYSRITEYKYFNEPKTDWTTISREYFNSKGDPFYPIMTNENINLYNKYLQLAARQNNTNFIGRLAEYKYYNMDQVVARSLKLFRKINE